MSTDVETTSDLRRWLCGHVCTTVMQSTPEWKRWLGQQLSAMPFERMSDATLIDLARKVLPEADVERALWTLPAERYEVEQLVLCPQCMDQRVVEVEPGRWARCERCNPLPEPVEGSTGAKFRGKR